MKKELFIEIVCRWRAEAAKEWHRGVQWTLQRCADELEEAIKREDKHGDG